MATNLERARLVSAHVQIEALSLKDARVDSNVDAFDPPAELEVNQQYRARWELAPATDRIFVFVNLHFTAGGDGESIVEQMVELDATYRVMYHLPNASGYPSDALQHFAELNGVYNVWPYWRELVQTVCGRVGIASFVVPVYRPPVRKLTPEEREQTEIPLNQAQSDRSAE